MGLLQQLGSMIEGQAMQRLAGGQGNFADSNSPDHQSLQQIISQASPAQMQSAFAQSAQQMDPQQYAQHLAPSTGGSPLANLQAPALAAIAGLLIHHLTTSAGLSPTSLLSQIPGLQSANPQQMNPDQVGSLAQYTQQNHPGIFATVASQLSQQNPSLLSSFLGPSTLASLASHLLQ